MLGRGRDRLQSWNHHTQRMWEQPPRGKRETPSWRPVSSSTHPPARLSPCSPATSPTTKPACLVRQLQLAPAHLAPLLPADRCPTPWLLGPPEGWGPFLTGECLDGYWQQPQSPFLSHMGCRLRGVGPPPLFRDLPQALLEQEGLHPSGTPSSALCSAVLKEGSGRKRGSDWTLPPAGCLS